MIEVSALLFTLLAEGVGLLSVILIIWVVITIRKKNKDKAAATKLVSHIKKHADDRLASIKTFLSNASGLETEELQLGVKKIDRLEKDFFTQLIRSYLKRDGDILSQMDEQLDKVVSAYKEAVAENKGTSSQTDEETINTIETLEKEKQALEDELRITKSTMGNMMTEFNTMFNGGNETVQTSKEALQSTVANVEEKQDESVNNVEDDIAIEESVINIDDDIAIEETKDEEIILESTDDTVIENDVVIESEEKEITNDDIDDDIFFSQNTTEEASAPKPMSESEDDFGSIVTSDDVDDILDGIDLSKEIDEA